MKIYLLLIVTLCICTNMAVQAQYNPNNQTTSMGQNNKTQLSLNDALRTALEKAEQLKIGRQNLKIAELDKNKANAGYLPNVNLLLQQHNQFSRPNLQTYFVNNTYLQNVLSPAVAAQWTVFNGFRQKIRWQQLQNDIELAQNELNLTTQNIGYEVKKKYFMALAEQEKLKIVKQIHAISYEHYKLYREQVSRGQASQYELLSSEQNALSDEINVRTTEKNFEKAVADLTMAMGSNSAHYNYVLSEKLNKPTKTFTAETLKSQAKQGATLKKWDIIQQNQQQNIEIAKSKLYPTVVLNSGLNLLLNSTKFIETTTIMGSNIDVYIGATLSMNLYDGGQNKRNIQKNKLQAELTQYQQQQHKREIEAQINSKINEYQRTTNILGLNERQMSLIQETLSLADQRLKAGLSNLTEFRNIQLQYLEAQLNYIDRLIQCKLLEIDMEQLSQ